MKRNVMLGVSLIAVIVSFSFLAAVYSQSDAFHALPIRGVNSDGRLVLSAPLVLGAALNDDSRLLNQPTRTEIYNFVVDNPGVHFRGICHGLGLSVGVVQYHVGLLVGAGLLSVYVDGRRRRYFEPKRFGEAEMKTISLVRHKTVGRILAVLSRRGSIVHKDLACKLGVSSQALTWQMKCLRSTGLVEVVKERMKVTYFLNLENASMVRHALGLISVY